MEGRACAAGEGRRRGRGGGRGRRRWRRAVTRKGGAGRVTSATGPAGPRRPCRSSPKWPATVWAGQGAMRLAVADRRGARRPRAARIAPAWVTTTSARRRRGRSARAARVRARSIATLSPPCGRAWMRSAAQASSSARGIASQGRPSQAPKSISREAVVEGDRAPRGGRRGARRGAGSGGAGSRRCGRPGRGARRGARPRRSKPGAGRGRCGRSRGRRLRRAGVADEGQSHASSPR